MGQVLRGVELFASGVYRGKVYTPADVDEIAANAPALAAGGLTPPAVAGHEEDRPDGTPNAAPEPGRTDQPADGWVVPGSVAARWKWDPFTRTNRRVLVGDIEGVPDAMAADIRARRYRKVSAEIYDDYTDDAGRGHGKALRRVAFLGGEVPQVKALADLPAPTKFAERAGRPATLRPCGGRPTAFQTFVAFSEVAPVDKEQMKAAILAAMPGLQPATLDAMGDDQLADLAKNLPAPAPVVPAVPVAAMDDGAAAPSRDEMIAKLTAAGQDPAALAAMDDAALAAALAALPPATPMSDKGKTPAKFAEAEADRIVARRLAKQKALAASEKRAEVDRFCDRLVRDGKLLPAQRGNVTDHLLGCDDLNPVHKFGENGTTVHLTAFEKAQRGYEAGPVLLRFAEKVLAGAGPKPGEGEVAAVRKFAEVQASALKAAGYKTPEQFVEKFSEMRKKDPALTAAQFGVPAEYAS